MSEANVAERLASSVVTNDNSADFYAGKLGLATEESPTCLLYTSDAADE